MRSTIHPDPFKRFGFVHHGPSTKLHPVVVFFCDRPIQVIIHIPYLRFLSKPTTREKYLFPLHQGRKPIQSNSWWTLIGEGKIELSVTDLREPSPSQLNDINLIINANHLSTSLPNPCSSGASPRLAKKTCKLREYIRALSSSHTT